MVIVIRCRIDFVIVFIKEFGRVVIFIGFVFDFRGIGIFFGYMVISIIILIGIVFIVFIVIEFL